MLVKVHSREGNNPTNGKALMADQLAVDFAARLAANGVTLKVRNDRLWLQPGRAYKDLSDEDRAFLRHHRAELKLIAERGVPVAKASSKPAPKPEEPEPEVYAYNHRITSQDVNEALEALGDETLTNGAAACNLGGGLSPQRRRATAQGVLVMYPLPGTAPLRGSPRRAGGAPGPRVSP